MEWAQKVEVGPVRIENESQGHWRVPNPKQLGEVPLEWANGPRNDDISL